MLRRLIFALLAIGLQGCSAHDPSATQSNEAAAVHNTALAKIALSSDAFENGQPIPVQYSCDGNDQVPALHWDQAPAGTMSFALVLFDPDAPGGTFRHWGVFDIPASTREVGGTQRVGSEVQNDFGKAGYGGPCPPKGHGLHHYHFKLFALDTRSLDVSTSAKVVDVEHKAQRHAIAEGELIGTYER